MANHSGVETYEGGAFHPELEKGKCGGYVFLDGGEVLFHSGNVSFALPLDGILIEMGGAANRLVFFKHPDLPGQTIYASDVSILNNRDLSSFRETRRASSKIRKTRLLGLGITLSLLCAILGSLFALYVFRGPMVAMIAAKLPVELEQTLGETSLNQFRGARPFIEDEALIEALNEWVEPLVRSVDSKRYQFEFSIANDPTLNAFALPGGYVVLHSGLIFAADRPEEVLGVLAHEIAHVTKQHGVRNVIESAGLFMLLQAFLGDVSGIAGVILSNSSFLLQQSFSREFEREADEIGVGYLIDAGIDPRGLYDFFLKLSAKEIEDNKDESEIGKIEDVLSLLSTHPATSERMATLEKIIDVQGDVDYEPSRFDLAGFKEKLHALTQE